LVREKPMFAICLDFPYEHQIKKIYKDVIYKILVKIEMLARENGCIQVLENDARFYFFDDEKIGATFFVARFLYLLSFTLDQVSSKIHEYRVIVEVFSSGKTYEDAVASFVSLKDSTLVYNKVCLASKASRFFKKYLNYSQAKGASVCVVEKFSFFDKMRSNEAFPLTTKTVPIFVRAGQSYIMALSNFMLMSPLQPSDLQHFSVAERKTYNETRCVLKFFAKNRFKERIEKYFVDSFIMHAQLHAKVYKRMRGLSYIDLHVDKQDKSLEAEKICKIIGGANIAIQKVQNVNIESIPDDLLELMYILLYSVRFIFVDETASFFFEMTGSQAYRHVLSCMYKLGIISKDGMLLSYKETALKQIEKKLKSKKIGLNTYITQFLLNKYKNAELCADINLKLILDALKCEYRRPEEKRLEKTLLVDVFFNMVASRLIISQVILPDDAIFQNIEVLKKYKDVCFLQENGETSSVLADLKELNAYFHQHRLLSGEYKTFVSLAFLYLQNNIGEAQTYCVYALGIAKKAKNDIFICEATYFLSLVYFLRKDFCNALESLQELSSVISSSFHQEWKVSSLILQGRVYLEIGEAKKASSLFSLAKEMSHRYFPSLLSVCNTWYARALLYAGESEEAIKILKAQRCEASYLFLLESHLLYPALRSLNDLPPSQLKLEYDAIARAGINEMSMQESSIENKQSTYDAFEYMEDMAWKARYKMSYAARFFNSFYSYYQIGMEGTASEAEKLEHLALLKEMAMESLYAKDANASCFLYLCYAAQCAIDGKVSGLALGFLSKACSVLQRVCTQMFDVNMRDTFIKENPWNAKLSCAARENKLL